MHWGVSSEKLNQENSCWQKSRTRPFCIAGSGKRIVRSSVFRLIHMKLDLRSSVSEEPYGIIDVIQGHPNFEKLFEFLLTRAAEECGSTAEKLKQELKQERNKSNHLTGFDMKCKHF